MFRERRSANISPYRVEPSGPPETGARSEPESYVLPEDARTGRLANISEWCRCRNCKDPVREVDCLCCVESAAVGTLRGDRQCVTLHSDFEAVCLNRSVLTVCLTAYKEFRNPSTDVFCNTSLRLAAYRQYTWWVHGYLGRGNRRVIPACVVSAIRSRYPNQSGVYVGFQREDDDGNDDQLEAGYWPE